MSKLERYKNIELFKNEFDDNYLLLNNNRTLSVGFFVKEILISLQNGVSSSSTIKDKINKKFLTAISLHEIEETIKILDNFSLANSDSFFLKIIKIFNPSSIKLNLDFLFNKYFFIVFIILNLFLNTLFIIFLQKTSINGIENWIIYIFLFISLLFTHEMGHALSAKAFGVNCKEIGLGLYIIFPVLYTNLGESWRLFKEKRVIINLSGIYFQLILGSLLGFSALMVNSTIFTYLFFSNLLIILLNLNPFIKLDGYWVVSDLLATKNLTKAAYEEVKNIFSKNSKKVINPLLLVYAFCRILFLIFMSYIMLSLIISFCIKVTNSTPLSFGEYFIVFIVLLYAFKFIKKRIK